jgi:hypothetical protein
LNFFQREKVREWASYERVNAVQEWGGGEERPTGLDLGRLCTQKRGERGSSRLGQLWLRAKRERKGERENKPFSFYIFTNLLQIQTNFEFKATQI